VRRRAPVLEFQAVRFRSQVRNIGELPLESELAGIPHRLQI
jgi:hypothetical protein